jgi:DNA polymerase
MVRAVARDMHKMHAFVRFRPVTDGDGHTVQVAWFEPDHYITEANAGFFVRRFTQMHWAILTPDASVRWDGSSLHVGPGGQRTDAPPPDAGEALWLTYYRHIFNPARLKTTMMKKEMPTRYWRNLPEAALITELSRGAHERSGHMVEAEGTVPRKRIEPLIPSHALPHAPSAH